MIFFCFNCGGSNSLVFSLCLPLIASWYFSQAQWRIISLGHLKYLCRVLFYWANAINDLQFWTIKKNSIVYKIYNFIYSTFFSMAHLICCVSSVTDNFQSCYPRQGFSTCLRVIFSHPFFVAKFPSHGMAWSWPGLTW